MDGWMDTSCTAISVRGWWDYNMVVTYMYYSDVLFGGFNTENGVTKWAGYYS